MRHILSKPTLGSYWRIPPIWDSIVSVFICTIIQFASKNLLFSMIIIDNCTQRIFYFFVLHFLPFIFGNTSLKSCDINMTAKNDYRLSILRQIIFCTNPSIHWNLNLIL